MFEGKTLKRLFNSHKRNQSIDRYLYCYVETALILRAMYQECDLIHADFSEYNLLYHHHRCHVIDVGQAVTKEHPQAESFLLRDCRNILTFFKKKGVEGMVGEDELYRLVVSSEESLRQMSSSKIPTSEAEAEGYMAKAVRHCDKLGPWSAKHSLITPLLFVAQPA